MTLWKLFLLSAVPLTEQRATIPIGIIVNDYKPLIVATVCYFGCVLPAPFILYFFEHIYEFVGKIKGLSIIKRAIDRKVNKNSKKFDRYKELALITFVGIPLPGTGVWTGAAIAAILRLDYKKSLITILIGNLVSAVLLVGLSLLFPALLNV